MKIDIHMHMTQPISLLVQRLEKNGFDLGVICSSAVARGEVIHTLADAQMQMGRVAGVQNRGVDKTTEQINREIAAAAAEYPGRLLAFGKVDLFQPGLAETVKQIQALGMAGVGEIVGLHGNTDHLPPLLQAAGEAKLPIFLHTDYPVDGRDLQALGALAERFSRTQIILGHMGGDFWMDAIALAVRLPNLWLDTSEVVNQVALQVAANTLPQRLLFATDYPWDAPESMLARIQMLENTQQVKAAILGENARRLLRLS